MAFDHAKLTRRQTRELVRRIRASLGVAGGTRAAVDAGGGSTAAAGFDRQAAWALYQAIFTPGVKRVAGRAKTYVIAADPVLSTIPLSVLVTAPPKGEDADPAALRATPWLIRQGGDPVGAVHPGHARHGRAAARRRRLLRRRRAGAAAARPPCERPRPTTATARPTSCR